MRLTPQRRAVLDVLRSSHDHPTAHEVFERVRAASPGIGFATVYRTLNLLVASGHALELALGESSARYDANVTPHDHLVCEQCGTAVDLPPAVPASVIDRVASDHDFVITNYDLKFRGRCPDCAAAASA